MLKENYKVLVPNVDKLSQEEYVEVRRYTFGASESAKLLGVNPFPNGSVDDMMEEKISGNFDDSISKKAIVRMGIDIEHIILRYVNEMMKIIHQGEYYLEKPTDMFGNENYLSINFDSIALTNNTFVWQPDYYDYAFPVELKSTTYGRKYYNFNLACLRTEHGEIVPQFIDVVKFRNKSQSESLEDYIKAGAEYYGIPVYYFTQLQQQMDAIEDCEFGYLGVMDVNNWEVYLFKIFRHDEICKALNENGSKYGNRMITKINLKNKKSQ